MSALNPNVFFEFGIRTALDKPVALTVAELMNEAKRMKTEQQLGR